MPRGSYGIFMKIVHLASIFLLCMSSAAFSADTDAVRTERSVGADFAYYPADQKGYGVSDGGFAPLSYTVEESDGSPNTRDLGSTWGGVEAKGYYIQRWIIPALRWSDGPLAAGNNVTIQSQTGVSPISLTQQVQVTATPIALLQFTGGVQAGTGWNVQLFDGLGEVDTVSGEMDDGSLEGIVLDLYLGTTIQFDLAAVVPGDWNHVVAVYSPKWTWKTFTGASASAPWSFENDPGDNYQGWIFGQTVFLGYQPPGMALQTTGFLLETERKVGETVDRATASGTGDWEPDFLETKLALVLNFSIGEIHSLTILSQLSRDRLASDSTIFNGALQARDVVGSYWDAYRIALSWRRSL